MAITTSGIVIRMAVEDIVLYGRATQGVIIMKVDGKDEKVVSITRVRSEDEEDENLDDADIIDIEEDSYDSEDDDIDEEEMATEETVE